MTRVAIIGAGLAGTACAYVLKQYGAEPVIYEASGEIAAGASGNMLGLYNPRLAAEWTEESQFYAAGFVLALEVFQSLCHSAQSEESHLKTQERCLANAQDDNIIDWKRCGSLHLVTEEKKQKRFAQCMQNWRGVEMRMVNAQEASEIAGVAVAQEALWLPDSGVVSPKKLCAAYAKDVEIHFHVKVHSLLDIEADAVVVACGVAAKEFLDLKLKAVRGQITQVRSMPRSQNIKCNLCYGGYMTPARDGAHMVGSTFQRWLDHTDIIPQDDRDNIGKLGRNIPALAGAYDILGHRAGVRATTDGHFPIAGRVQENIYVSAAHGSHGIVSTIAAAHMIAGMIMRQEVSLPETAVRRLGKLLD